MTPTRATSAVPLVFALLLLSSCTSGAPDSGAPPRVTRAEVDAPSPSTTSTEAAAPPAGPPDRAGDAATEHFIRPVNEEAWAAEIVKRLPPAWTSARFGPYQFLFDGSVEAERVEDLGRLLNALRTQVFHERFPPIEPLPPVLLFRIFKDRTQYGMYGGPANTVAYYSPADREAVCCSDAVLKDDLSGRGSTGFHQYLYHALGEFNCGDWFATGLAEYFGGFRLDNHGQLRATEFESHRRRFRSLVGSRLYIPLKRFVDLTREEMTARDIIDRETQAWSLARFLSEQKDPEWSGILSRYYITLRDSLATLRSGPGVDADGKRMSAGAIAREARDRALMAAFGNFDDAAWARLERAWLKFDYR